MLNPSGKPEFRDDYEVTTSLLEGSLLLQEAANKRATENTGDEIANNVAQSSCLGTSDVPQQLSNAKAPFDTKNEEDRHHDESSEEAFPTTTTTNSIREIKKMPSLPELTLPATPESPEDETDCTGHAHSSDSDSSDEACPLTIPPLLRRISIPPHGRRKTRLQDPPPLTQAVQNQLTHCSSSLLRRRASLALCEQQNLKIDGTIATNTAPNGVETTTLQPPLTSLPTDIKPNATGPPILEEDPDLLDDEKIPASKILKSKENKWTLFTQWFGLILLVGFLACSLKIASLKRVAFLSLNLWRWDALMVVLFCGRLISGWIVKLLVMLIENHYILKKRVLYFVYGLRRSVKNCVWLALVLGVWETIFQGLEDNKSVNVLTKILWCFFTASLSWMVKVLAVKVAASSFHRTAYFERIQECLFNQYLLEKLSGPPTMEGIADEGEEYEGYKKLLTRTERRKQKNRLLSRSQGVYRPGSSSPKGMQEGFKRSRRLSKQIVIEIPGHTTVEVGEVPASSFLETRGRRASTATPTPLIARSPIPIEQEKLQELTSDTVSVWTLKRLMKLVRKTNISTYSSIISQETDEGEIGSELQAKDAAKQIFYNMARPGQKSLMMKDFLYFLSEEQAARAFSLFETTESGEITKRALTKWVVGVYKERRALALTLNDNRTVVAKLHKVLNAEMNVLNTIFLGPCNEKLYYPNSLLSLKAISNYYRSPDQGDAIEFQIHMNTPVEKLGMLKERMQRYIEGLPQFWYPDFKIVCDRIQDSNKMCMAIWMRHRLNFQAPSFFQSRVIIAQSKKLPALAPVEVSMLGDGGERFQRRSNMLLYFKQQLEDLSIGYQLPGQVITVTGIPCTAAS